MRVDDLMTRDVATVRASDSLARAVELMQERDCGCVVVTGPGAVLEGIVTDRDASLAALRIDEPLSRIEVRESMTGDVLACAPDDTIDVVERTMGHHQVRRLPVVDRAGRLCGLLSLDDIAREARREKGLLAPPVSEEGVGRTLGQVSRPHLLQTD